jgi:hypothetical protein
MLRFCVVRFFSGVVLAGADSRDVLVRAAERPSAAELGLSFSVEGPRPPFCFV